MQQSKGDTRGLLGFLWKLAATEKILVVFLEGSKRHLLSGSKDVEEGERNVFNWLSYWKCEFIALLQNEQQDFWLKKIKEKRN